MQTVYAGLGMLGLAWNPDQASLDLMRSTFMNHLSDYGISYGTKEELEFRY